jgi:RHS repeat-associated protein
VPRTGVPFAINNSALAYDAVLLQANGAPTGIPPGTYSLFNVTNKVFLDIDQSKINHFFLTQFSVTVNIEIKTRNENGTLNPSQNISLTVDYDTATLYRYTEKNSFTFNNAYWVEAKITSISNTAAIPFIRLNNTMVIERYKPLAMITPVFNTAVNHPSSDEIEVNWNAIEGAEEYDLEWTFIDDYNEPVLLSGGGYQAPFMNAANMDYSFTNNATRVTIKGTFYKLPVIGEHGFLLFRVRGVGYTGAVFTHRKEGVWSSAAYGDKIQNTGGNSFSPGKDMFHFVHAGAMPGMLIVHEKTLNWQFQTVFAEEGKNKTVMGYYDGAMKSRQNVTRISTDEMAIAAEDIYDFQGRKAGSFLPVPTFENKLRYYADFNLSAGTNKPYNETDFDLSTNHCIRTIGPVSISSGAGRYYSINNPNSSAMHHEYLPDAQQYPFMLTEYMPDGTGRIRRQGGVGPVHQIGSGHETKYFYGTPDAEELDRLFGNAVGHAEHYQKNMVIDPNGQVSVSYLDLQGRVIATALAGDNPSAMQGLPNKGNPSVLDVAIKINKQSDIYDKHIETTKTILVAQPGNYTLDYSITIPRLTEAQTPNLCYDCVYQLDIELIDECGANVLDGDINTGGVQKLTRTIGKPLAGYDVNCEGAAVEYKFTSDANLGSNAVAVNLQVGAYTLVKTLRVDETAMEYYTTQYLAANAGLKTFEDFKQEYEQSADFGQCEISCTECLSKLGTYPAFLVARLQEISSAGGTPNGTDTNIILKTWQALEAHCAELCTENSNNRCNNLLALLKTDISPGGQYAPVLEDNTIGGIFSTDLSSISSLGFNYKYHWENTGHIADRQPISYVKNNNEPILISVLGISKTPNELTPKEFEAYFNDDIAAVLVQYHPEYCKYLNCSGNQAAEDYEQEMLKTETYTQALAAGYMNPVNEASAPCSANNLDPWFQSGGNGYGSLQDMRDIMKEYQSQNPEKPECLKLSIWQLCQAYFVCGSNTCVEINNCLNSTPWGSVTCQPYLDQMWRMFRAIYLAERRKMMEAQMSSSCPRTAAMTGKVERELKLSGISGNFTSQGRNIIKAENRQRLLSECDTACMAKARTWYLQFAQCGLSAADSADLIGNFVKVCRNACDENHPFGASSSPKNRTQRVATPYYSFQDVFNKMVSLGKIIPQPGKCDINLIAEMPYGHNFDKNVRPEGDTACIKNYNALDPCVKNAPSLDLKRVYQRTNPPNDTDRCDKCIKCSELKDALIQIQSEYGMTLPDSTIGWRSAITNRLNQLLGFNLYWHDYWDFMEKCTDIDSTFAQSVINHFMMNYTGIDIPERMRRFDDILKDRQPYMPVPVREYYYASLNNAPLSVPGNDSTLLSTCICNKLATFKQSWQNNNNGYPTFNQYMANQCGFNPGQQFDFDAISNTCQNMYNLRGKALQLPGAWTNNQKNTFNNFVLKRNIYVPKLCSWDCIDTPITNKNPFLNPGKFGNSNNPPAGYTPGTKPVFRKGVTCDSFWHILDSMQSILGGAVNIRTLLRINLFSGNSNAIQANMAAFLQIKNAFYSRYTHEVEDTRFGNDALKAILAWLNKYKNCIMDELGYDADGASCCYKPNRYARALNTLLNKLSEPLDEYGNRLIEDQWNMHPPIPEYYNSVLYSGSNKPSVKYVQNPYDLPTLVMDMDDQNGVKRTVRLNYVDNLNNEAYYGDIVAFMHLQPVRMNGPCDTAHYFKVKVVQKVSWGYDTTWLTGYAPNWNLMDTCDRNGHIQLCDKNYYELPWKVDTLTCEERIAMMVNYHALRAYDEYILNVKNDFRKRYMDKCLDPMLAEVFTINKPVFEYHYTLYYYDQAGNLLQTVPPAGVQPLANAQLGAVQTARANNTSGTFPVHNLKTRYKYNTLNQLIWQQTPDAGESQFWYDNVGRLVISRNAKQALNQQYSYTHFDALGRITEVGQLENIAGGAAMNWNIAFDPVQLANFIAAGSHKQVTKTYYDDATPGFTYMAQDNLRKRVSGMEYSDDATGSVISGVYYTYDIHGNVTSLVRRNEGLNILGMAYTRTDYAFDLISGKVNRVDYQQNKSDWFIHRYGYDADNRITDVFTSDNNTFFDRDASYFYYAHGPMKRMEMGDMKVQGLDYVYTLHGWIKGANSSTLQAYRDPGKDGLAGLWHENVCRDVAAFNLGYYEGEYKAIGNNTGGNVNAANNFTPSTTGSPLDNAAPNLYNGNIRHMITALKPFMYNKTNNTWSSPQAMAYNYDQLNRIISSHAFASGNVQTTNNWGAAMAKQEYQENYAYDPNGNILTLYRNGHNPGLPQMDQFTYSYRPGTNQLDHVADAVAAGNYTNDIDNQNSGNYDYDAIGNLIKDDAEEIASIEWTVYGKISKVLRTAASQKPDLEFTYSPDGHRITKKVIGKGPGAVTSTTYYSHDAQGNHMATYLHRNDSLVWETSPIYGSARVGVYEAQKLLLHNGMPVPSGLAAGYQVGVRGLRRYEISNHLGNVLTTISDRRSMVVNGSGVIQYYEAEITSATDFYPFGMTMQGRSFSVAGKYRYGFNGQEQESELGDYYSFDYRIHDSRLGRFLSVDPLYKDYPGNGTYVFAENCTIWGIDFEGLEIFYTTTGEFLGHMGNSQKIKVVNDEYIDNVQLTQEEYQQHYLNPEKLRELRIKRISNNINMGVVFLNAILDGNSIYLHEASMKTGELVISDIYKRCFQSINKEKIKANHLDHAYAEYDRVDNTINVDIWSKYGVNVNDDKYSEEYPFDDLNNLLSTFVHEREHVKGLRGDGFSHFMIQKTVFNSEAYKRSSIGYKSHVEYRFEGYLADQENFLSRQTELYKQGKSMYSKGQLKGFLMEYNKNVDWYNGNFNKNKIAEDYEIND